LAGTGAHRPLAIAVNAAIAPGTQAVDWTRLCEHPAPGSARRGRTLRHQRVVSLYPANPIFTQGLLTSGGATAHADHPMIQDAGLGLELASGESVPADPDSVLHL